jgi:hypothetical protein
MLDMANNFEERKKFSTAVIEHVESQHHVAKNWKHIAMAIEDDDTQETLPHLESV